jgi:hypothetical protein
MFVFNICSSAVAGDVDERGERDDEERGTNDRGDRGSRGIIGVICGGGGGGGGAVGIGSVDVAAAAVVVKEDEKDVFSSTIGSVSVTSAAAVCVDSDFCTTDDTRASKHQPRRFSRNTYHVDTTRCDRLGLALYCLVLRLTSDSGGDEDGVP